MSTYYEILQISSDATVAEIETACERQYNHWRRLVTHHDPNMVNEANQALRQLDKARVTLLDPDARRAYDAGIGLGGLVGGLTDPQMMSQVQMPTPPPPRTVPQVQSTLRDMQRVDAWICPKCQASNAVETRFCKKCGHKLGTECVKCGVLIEVGVEFCPACGVNVSKAVRQKEMEEAERIRTERETERRLAEEKAQQEAEERKLASLKLGLGIMGCILGAISAPLAWAVIWPDVVEESICAGIQIIMGAIGGGVASVRAGSSVGSSDSGVGYVVGFVAGILGGILAFPILIIGIIISML